MPGLCLEPSVLHGHLVLLPSVRSSDMLWQCRSELFLDTAVIDVLHWPTL